MDNVEDVNQIAKAKIFILSEMDAELRPVGVVTLILEQGVYGHPLLSGLLVDAPERRRGIGRKLIKRAETRAKEFKASSLFAVAHPANDVARAFFKHLGYSEMILLEKKL